MVWRLFATPPERADTTEADRPKFGAPSLYSVTWREIKMGCYELGRRGLRKVSQQPIPIAYEYVRIATGFKAHLVVEDKVIVEIKSIELIAPAHKKQLLTYLPSRRPAAWLADQLPRGC